MDMIYLDNSATTKPHKEVINEVAICMERYFANPSSAHKLGIDAERKIKEAREKVARMIGASTGKIIFTSGGSEANNTAIRSAARQGAHIISTKIEHPSVLRLLKSLEEAGTEVTYLDVDPGGIINIGQLESSIKDNTRLVTIMHVNNEIGSIQPVKEIVDIVRSKSRRIKIHIDAVQSAGKIPIDIKKLDVDIMSISAHKIHGPKGVGALYIKKGLTITPLIAGGGQEMNLRSGTENLPGISGFGTAADMASENMEDKSKKVHSIKEHFIERLSEIDRSVINSPLDDTHIDNILSVSFEGVRGEVLLHALEDYNVYVSTGSACSARDMSHKNYVLPAIGLKKCHIESTIRFSFSYMNTEDEVDYTIDALKKVLQPLRRLNK